MDRYGSSFSDSDEHRPVMWLRGYPIYAAHFIVLVYVVSMLATVLLKFTPLGPGLMWLPFQSDAVLHGQIWRIVTYGLVNEPSLNFAIDMVMIAWFGREVERAFGRRTFLIFYAGVYLVAPLLFTVLGPWLPLIRVGETGALAIFVAFATIYPEALMMFNLLAKWAAIILVGIFSLIAINYRDWTDLLSLWATCGFAYAFVRHHQGHFSLPKLPRFGGKPKLRVLPDLPAKKSATGSAPSSSSSSGSASSLSAAAEVDALLDKIAKSGYASLTAKERERLESQSRALKKNSGRS
jgi:membrane associated rhomboid family serine protease